MIKILNLVVMILYHTVDNNAKKFDSLKWTKPWDLFLRSSDKDRWSFFPSSQ